MIPQVTRKPIITKTDVDCLAETPLLVHLLQLLCIFYLFVREMKENILMLDVQMYDLSFVQIMHCFQKLPSKMLNLSICEDRVVPSLLEIEQGSSIILLHKNKNEEFA